jgi:hypothetical protein
MLMTRLKLAAAMLLVMSVVLGGVTQTNRAAAEDQPPATKETPGPQAADRLDGILQAVDADKNNLRLMVTRDKDEELTLDLAKDVAVTINGARIGFQKKEGTLADLKAGMRVRVQLSEDKKVVVSIDEQRSQQGAQRRDCPKCKTCCGLELSREWCESFALYKGQLTCWCEIAQFVIGTQGGRSAESSKIKEKEWAETMDQAFALAKKEKKLLLHIGNTGG